MNPQAQPRWIFDLRQSFQRAERVSTHVCGSVLVAFESDTHEIERASILISPEGIRVVEGAEALADLPILFVQGRVRDWLSYVAEPTVARLLALRMYGETSLLSTLTESYGPGGLVGFRARLSSAGRSL